MRAAIAIFISLLLVSCFDKGDCLLSNTPLAKVSAMNFATPTTAKTITFTSIHSPGDTPLYPPNTALSTFVLLLDPGKTQMTYVFQYENRSDTLVLDYTNQTLVLSPDCGAFVFQRDLKVNHSTFGEDRVRIKNDRLLTSATLNLEIFF